ncbi:hypothetical protein FQN52_004240 [Onygenales sp. PD_12]|nr:hypothetical protein FQN52_004240 [Onygenales sp. PD_12]KAK2779196.1 hypothetical protein FQN53_001519 [Emmonsiellopsis sp. PD_33]
MANLLTPLLLCYLTAIFFIPALAGNPAAYKSDSDFRDAILSTTNKYRAEHKAPPLKWDQALADASLKHAKKCIFEHSGNPGGENIAAGFPDPSSVVQSWGNERDKFDFANGGFSEETGHFTQLVWKATKAVGCARVDCGRKNGARRMRGRRGVAVAQAKGGKADGWYVVCEYSPAGNVKGGYRENVQKKG